MEKVFQKNGYFIVKFHFKLPFLLSKWIRSILHRETDSGWVYLRVGCISLVVDQDAFYFSLCVCVCMYVVCLCVCVCENEFLVRSTAVCPFPIFKPVVRPVAGVVPVACVHLYI